uniref:Uncharacterized protein n=1 Tax=Oryza rufipogon TaxID=4529 RepID=A0A0E0P624_ORYRU
MNDGQGYFAGKPAKPNDKEQQAGDEETQAVDAQTPGGTCPCLAGVGGAASKKKSGRVLYAYNSAESFK